MIRVVVADDSAIVRGILEMILQDDPEIRLVGQATNGEEAVQAVRDLRPDVLLMDVRMPVMDGIEATSRIMAEIATPILVLSAALREDADIAFRAIQAGAIDVVEKPQGTLRADYSDIRQDLIRRVKLVSKVPPIRRVSRSVPGADDQAAGSVAPAQARDRLPLAVVIGASTGGPPALATVLGGLGPSFPVPVLAVQHISSGFLNGFVEWLDSAVELEVRVAVAGEKLLAGCVYFAPEDRHLGISRNCCASLSDAEPRDGHRPAVDVLFESAAAALGNRVVGVLLTGMGRDGADGLRALQERGAPTVCQDEATSVVYGIPAAAAELGAADAILPVERVSFRILSLLGRGA